MDVSEIKENIQALVTKLDTIEEDDYDGKKLHNEFIKPFFETLGWDFETDVKEPDSITENKADYAFQIDGVSRFYLSVVPPSKSLEDRKQILPLTGFAYNKGVTWAILTNFKETRVYNTEAPGTSPRAMQHYSFSSSEYISKFEELLNLTKKQFSLKVLDSDAEYFGKKPKRVPIDQQLLKDLLSYRDMLVDDITKNNSIPEEQAEQAVQKILNRLIFIRSCGDRQIEDRHLKSSLGDWQNNKNKKLVEYLREIFEYFRRRYGSSLFEKHTCDNLIISDHVLEEIIEGLYQSKEKSFLSYDFSLISSDILGKMYENYLGTIQKKQDGAYYTPNYISKYIAENTIIPYLSKSNVTNIPDLISEYADNIKELESKIHNIKILDPACGTGEFLIRAIDVLLKISRAIQNHKEKSGKYSHTGKKKKSEPVTYATFDKEIEGQELRTIIQNNIYGVDINEEAIEITQLNLFLKLATSSKQLPDVSKNLRVGNSLIDDKSVDPKAFDWEKTFLEKFDVIIGNPPYLKIELLEENTRQYFHQNYQRVFMKRFDAYGLFIDKGISLLIDGGLFGMIVPSTMLNNITFTKLRKLILDLTTISQIVNLGGKIFQNVNNDTQILLFKNTSTSAFDTEIYDVPKYGGGLKTAIKINSVDFLKAAKPPSYGFELRVTKDISMMLSKMKINSTPLDEICDPFQGLIAGNNEAFIVAKKQADSEKLERAVCKPVVFGDEVKRYERPTPSNYVIYLTRSDQISNFPKIKKRLDQFKNSLQHRVKGKLRTRYYLHRPRKSTKFECKPKLLVQCIRNLALKRRIVATIDYDKLYADHTLNALISKNSDYDLRYVLGILNSKIINFSFQKKYIDINIKAVYLCDIPIPQVSKQNQKPIIEKVNQILSIAEKKEVLTNTHEMNKIDAQLDELVYKLYNITEEEKKIIESI